LISRLAAPFVHWTTASPCGVTCGVPDELLLFSLERGSSIDLSDFFSEEEGEKRLPTLYSLFTTTKHDTNPIATELHADRETGRGAGSCRHLSKAGDDDDDAWELEEGEGHKRGEGD